MAKEVLIHSGIAELCVAMVENGTLIGYWCETTLDQDCVEADGAFLRASQCRVGDVVLGRVVRVVPAIDAAFVDIGEARDGFLNARDAQKGGSREAPPHISDCVHEGEKIVVQVLKEAMAGKGTRLGTSIGLAGRHVVFSPGSGRVALSRRIADADERARLQAIMAEIVQAQSGAGLSAGYVVRTAAIGATAEELRGDADRLATRWQEIMAASETATPPERLHRESSSVVRVLRDWVGSDVARVVIDDDKTLQLARAYAQDAMPEMAERICGHGEKRPLFACYGIEDQIANLAPTTIVLPSGAWITIEPTEALTAIDVNSGRRQGGESLQATALAVDLEAAEMIARQVGVRGLGGMIAIDFLPLADEKAFSQVVDLLRTAMARDGTPVQIAVPPGMNLVVMTRKRVRPPFGEHRSEPCEACDGHGRRPTITGVALEIFRQVENTAAAAPGKPIVVHAANDVATWLGERKEVLRAALARYGVANLRVVPEAARGRGNFTVTTAGAEHGAGTNENDEDASRSEGE